MTFTQDQKREIQRRFKQIETKEQLLDLFNFVREILYPDMPFTLKAKTFNYYSNPLLSPNRYKSFTIPKKSGELRLIHSPVKGLKLLLRILNSILQALYDPPDQATGFVPGKSIVDNAKPHIGKPYVHNVDLKDFFFSFDRNAVKLGLMRPPFSLKGKKEPIAFVLASLATHPLLHNGEMVHVLPQGSPASPMITNILCNTLDRRLNGLAKRFNATYSRYADDISFSAGHNLFYIPEFVSELERIIQGQGLMIQETKSRVQNASQRQEATGLVVNKKVNVKRPYVKRLRMWLYYWENYGEERAQSLFISDYINDKGHVKSPNASLRNVVEGKLQFMAMVKGNHDPTYQSLYKRFVKLVRKKSAIETDVPNVNFVVEKIVTDGLQAGLSLYEKLKGKTYGG